MIDCSRAGSDDSTRIAQITSYYQGILRQVVDTLDTIRTIGWYHSFHSSLHVTTMEIQRNLVTLTSIYFVADVDDTSLPNCDINAQCLSCASNGSCIFCSINQTNQCPTPLKPELTTRPLSDQNIGLILGVGVGLGIPLLISLIALAVTLIVLLVYCLVSPKKADEIAIIDMS